MRSTASFMCRWAFASTLSAMVALSTSAWALPQLGQAAPATVGVANNFAYNSWQQYQRSSGETRYCARECLGLGRYAGILEVNTVNLSRLAANPALSDAEHKRILADYTAVSKKRNDVTFDFLQCFTQSRPVAGRCGIIRFPAAELGWAQWCADFAGRVKKLNDLLIQKVGSNVGTWQIQSNLVRISHAGDVEPDSIFIAPSPGTILPPTTTPTVFRNFIAKSAIGEFPVISAVQVRMYMPFTARVIRLPGPAANKALPASLFIPGNCPGPVNRPAL